MIVAGCGGDDTQEIPDNQQPLPTADLVEETVADVAGDTAGGAASACAEVEAPEPADRDDATKPSEPLDADLTWTLTFDTSCGTFVVTLDPESAPETTASLVALAEDGFFDGTVFHRIVPGFVIQGGDPSQSGSGGPGYQTVDAPPADATYTHGVVAMAKAPQEAAGTSGSQFFVVTGEDSGLTPEYAIVGEVTDGLDIVDLIGTLGEPTTEAPTQVVLISSVTVESTP